MNCGCEHKRLASERERIRRLAKAFAITEETTVAMYRNEDDTYGFEPIDRVGKKEIVEYITPY